MLLALVLQIFLVQISTFALGKPIEVPDKCSTSSPNYCVCRENDTVLLKPVTLCLSPTDQNDLLIQCFPCFVSDQDHLSCTSLKDEYPVCPLQLFQSGESRSQLYNRANYTISKPNFTESITKPMQDDHRDDFHKMLTTEFQNEKVEQILNSLNKNLQQYIDFDKNLSHPTIPSKKLIQFAAIEELADSWFKILRLHQYADIFEFDNAEEINEIESNSGNSMLLINTTENSTISENLTEEGSSIIENFELPAPMDVSKDNIDSSLEKHNLTLSKPKSTGKKHTHPSYKKLRPSHLKFKNWNRYKSTSLPYEFNYVSKHPDETFSNIFKDIGQFENGNMKKETIFKIRRSLLVNETHSDEAIARLTINESDVRSRSKRSTWPQNNWCSISRNRRNGNLECTIWTYKKECMVSCHKGYEIEGKSSLNTSCDRKNNKWEPKSISQACKECDDSPKERSKQQIIGKPGYPGDAEVFIPEYEPDFGEENHIDNNHFDFGGELPTHVVQPINEKYSLLLNEGFLPDYGQLNDYSKNIEGEMNNLEDNEQAGYPDYYLEKYGRNALGEAEHDTKK